MTPAPGVKCFSIVSPVFASARMISRLYVDPIQIDPLSSETPIPLGPVPAGAVPIGLAPASPANQANWNVQVVLGWPLAP